jgi:hypothetical protein
MTKRKPLQWFRVGDNYEMPGCMECDDYLSQPFMAEAASSVAIENGGDLGSMLRRLVDRYHANRHQEEA